MLWLAAPFVCEGARSPYASARRCFLAKGIHSHESALHWAFEPLGHCPQESGLFFISRSLFPLSILTFCLESSRLETTPKNRECTLPSLTAGPFSTTLGAFIFQNRDWWHLTCHAKPRNPVSLRQFSIVMRERNNAAIIQVKVDYRLSIINFRFDHLIMFEGDFRYRSFANVCTK